MRLWRICRKRWAQSAFDGEGACKAGGRWNYKDESVVYCSMSLSLASLELFVHLDPPEIPDDLVCIDLIVPDDVAGREVVASELPSNWRVYPAPDRLQEIGSDWIRSGETLWLSVPSAVVPLECNVLVNPAHADFSRCEIGSPTPFHFDPRLWK